MAEAELPPDHEMMALIPELAKHTSKRKARLYACACCRRIWSLMPDEWCREVVDIAERFADGAVNGATLGDATKRAKRSFRVDLSRGSEPAYRAAEACYFVTLSNVEAALQACESAVSAQAYAQGRTRNGKRNGDKERDALYREFTYQTHLLRELLGNPGKPVAFNPRWCTPTATSIAQQMYESRDFSTMPTLADALQDVGCDNADILNHCRDANATHVRGCWVVDMVLGKS
jgi:hypothetical protein